jgi:hypothetical protein
MITDADDSSLEAERQALRQTVCQRYVRADARVFL